MLRLLGCLLAVALVAAFLLLAGCQTQVQRPDIEALSRSVVYIQRATGRFVTGWVLDEGRVITVAHGEMQGGALGSTVSVLFRDGEVLGGAVTWANPRLDIAVVSVSVPLGYAAASLSCGPIRTGQPIVAVGHPARLLWVSSFGYVATLSIPQPRPGFSRSQAVVQLSVAGGMSGAPVFDHAGQVIGMVQFWVRDGVRPTGFAAMLRATAICETGLMSPSSVPLRRTG